MRCTHVSKSHVATIQLLVTFLCVALLFDSNGHAHPLPDTQVDFGEDLWMDLPNTGDSPSATPVVHARQPGTLNGPYGALFNYYASIPAEDAPFFTYSLRSLANGAPQEQQDVVRWSGIVCASPADGTVRWLSLTTLSEETALELSARGDDELIVGNPHASVVITLPAHWDAPTRFDVQYASSKSTAPIRLWINDTETVLPEALRNPPSAPAVSHWTFQAAPSAAHTPTQDAWVWSQTVAMARGEGEPTLLLGIDDALPPAIVSRDVEENGSVGWTVKRHPLWFGWDTAWARILWSQEANWPGDAHANATPLQELIPEEGSLVFFRENMTPGAPLHYRVEVKEDDLMGAPTYLTDVVTTRTVSTYPPDALPAADIDTYIAYCWKQYAAARPYGFAQAMLKEIEMGQADVHLSFDEDNGLYRDERSIPNSLGPLELVSAPDRSTPFLAGSPNPLLEVEWESRRDPWLARLLAIAPAAVGAFSDHDVHNNQHPRWERQDIAAPQPFAHMLRSELWARMVAHINQHRRPRNIHPGPDVNGPRLLSRAGHHYFDQGPVRRLYLDLGRFTGSTTLLGTEQLSWARALTQAWKGRILEIHAPFPVHGAVQKRNQDVSEDKDWVAEFNLLLTDAQQNDAIESVVIIAGDAHIPILHVRPNPDLPKVRAEFYAGAAASPWLSPALLPEERNTTEEIRQYVRTSHPLSWVEDFNNPDAIGSGLFLRTFGRVRYHTTGEITFTLLDADFDRTGARTWDQRVLRQTTLTQHPDDDCMHITYDLTGDCSVNATDIAALLATWGLAPPGTPADFDEDGEVGPTDLAMLLSAWTG